MTMKIIRADRLTGGTGRAPVPDLRTLGDARLVLRGGPVVREGAVRKEAAL